MIKRKVTLRRFADFFYIAHRCAEYLLNQLDSHEGPFRRSPMSRDAVHSIGHADNKQSRHPKDDVDVKSDPVVLDSRPPQTWGLDVKISTIGVANVG